MTLLLFIKYKNLKISLVESLHITEQRALWIVNYQGFFVIEIKLAIREVNSVLVRIMRCMYSNVFLTYVGEVSLGGKMRRRISLFREVLSYGKSLILVAGVIFVAPIYVHASDYNVEVCALQSQSTSNAAFLQPCGGWERKTGCAISNNWITWDMSHAGGNAMYSTALTALVSGKRVKVRINDNGMGDKDCVGNYDATTMIRLMK